MRSDACPLQGGAAGHIMAPLFAYLRSGKLLALTIGRYVADAQVHPDGLFCRGDIRGLLALRDMQEVHRHGATPAPRPRSSSPGHSASRVGAVLGAAAT